MLILFVLMIVNFGISCWDAYVAGRIWREVTGLMKLVAWSALTISACGFLIVTAIICGYIALAAHWTDARGMHALMSMTYLMIIIPVLGSGLIITIHSWVEAYKRRDFGSIATAAWNTGAQGYNMYEAADGGISSAFSDVAGFFAPSGDDDDVSVSAAKVAVLLVLIVAMIFAAGFTVLFFQMGKRAALPSYAELRQVRRA